MSSKDNSSKGMGGNSSWGGGGGGSGGGWGSSGDQQKCPKTGASGTKAQCPGCTKSCGSGGNSGSGSGRNGWECQYSGDYYDEDIENEYFEEICDNDNYEMHCSEAGETVRIDNYDADEDEDNEQTSSRYSHSAPGRYWNVDNCTNPQISSNEPCTPLKRPRKRYKLIDFDSSGCDSDGLEDLLDSDVLQTVVLHTNTNLKSLCKLNSSESESEISDYIKSRPKNVVGGRFSEVRSGYTLTTNHNSYNCNATKNDDDGDIMDPKSYGFGKANIMRQILTTKEQLMLGIIPCLNQSSSIIDKPQETVPQKFNSMHLKRPKTRTIRRNDEEATKNNGVLKIDRIKIVPCEDPAAAGDSFSINAERTNCFLQKNHKFSIIEETQDINSATCCFKRVMQDVILQLPQDPAFILEKQRSSNNLHEYMKPVNSLWVSKLKLKRSVSKPVLVLHDSTFSSKTVSVLSFPSVELQKCSSYHHRMKNKSLAWEYKSPKPKSHITHHSCHSKLKKWHAQQNIAELDEGFKNSCAQLWSCKLEGIVDGPTATQCQSETRCDKLKLKNAEKIKFTYTSNESFFTPLNTSKEFETSFSPPVASVSTTRSLQMKATESNDTIANCLIDGDDDVEIDNELVSSSSSSDISFKNNIESSTLESGSSEYFTEHSKAINNFTQVNSASYTVIKLGSDAKTTCYPDLSRKTTSRESNVSENSFISYFSDDSSFTSASEPSCPQVSTSESDECFANEVKMTDKMTFKFFLDETGSEVEISVALPFPIPTTEIPVESPLMAAAVLGKAQELILQSIGGYNAETDATDKTFDQPTQSYILELPALQCSISLEELLERSTGVLSYRPSYERGEDDAVGGLIEDFKTLVCEPICNFRFGNPEIAHKLEETSIPIKESWIRIIRIMKYIFRLLLCNSCRRPSTKIVPNVNNAQCFVSRNKSVYTV